MATDENIRYIDVDSGMVKTSHHAVFDEAWYLQHEQPPMAQLLFDMEMECEDVETTQTPVVHKIPMVPVPPTCMEKPINIPSAAKNTPIPLHLSASPIQNQKNARAANTVGPYENTKHQGATV
jgi:hypothetical protein